MNLAAMIIGYYTISAYVLGTLAMIIYWLALEREMRKRTGEVAKEKRATRTFVLGLGFYWWGASPVLVPMWLISIPKRVWETRRNQEVKRKDA